MDRNVEIIGVNRIAYNRSNWTTGEITRRKVLLTNAEMDYLKQILNSNDPDKDYQIDNFCYNL